MRVAWSDGIAKPMPMLPAALLCPLPLEPAVAMAELMPTTWPFRSDQRAAGVARIDRRVGLDGVEGRLPLCPRLRPAGPGR